MCIGQRPTFSTLVRVLWIVMRSCWREIRRIPSGGWVWLTPGRCRADSSAWLPPARQPHARQHVQANRWLAIAWLSDTSVALEQRVEKAMSGWEAAERLDREPVSDEQRHALASVLSVIQALPEHDRLSQAHQTWIQDAAVGAGSGRRQSSGAPRACVCAPEPLTRRLATSAGGLFGWACAASCRRSSQPRSTPSRINQVHS
jgi:hypothetical protein